jgi:hypothetical protein
MNAEDEEFNRMEREAEMRRKAVRAALNDHVMHMRAHLSEYERGVIDGRQIQVQSSVDKAVNALSKREWVGLTEDEITECFKITPDQYLPWQIYRRIEAKLKEKNEM